MSSIKELTKEQRVKELHSFVNLCFSMMEQLDFNQVAERSGLSKSTVYNLWNDRASLATRFGTIQALGYAAGLKLELTKTKFKLRLIA